MYKKKIKKLSYASYAYRCLSDFTVPKNRQHNMGVMQVIGHKTDYEDISVKISAIWVTRQFRQRQNILGPDGAM